MRNNYKPFSMHLNPELFQPATAEEKAYISTMRPSTTFFKDGVKRLLKNKLSPFLHYAVWSLFLLRLLHRQHRLPHSHPEL